MLSTAYFTFSVACGFGAYASYRNSAQLQKEKKNYLSRIIQSNNIDSSHFEPNTSFLLRHDPLNDNHCTIVSVKYEEYIRRREQIIIPRSRFDPYYTTSPSLFPEFTLMYDRIVDDVVMTKLDPIIKSNLHNTLCIGKNIVSDRPKILLNSFKNLPTYTIHGDYGTIRDMLKKYDIMLSLNNVGTVYATFYDCKNIPLYLNAKVMENTLYYDVIASKSTDVADYKFDSAIGLNQFYSVLSFCGVIAFGVLGSLAIKK